MFSEKLKYIMKQKNITQKELADMLELKQAQISKWITGKRSPNYQSIEKIAHALNVPVAALVEDMDYSNPNIITDLVKVPIIGEIPAGMPIEAVEEYIDAVHIPKQLASEHTIFGLRVKGDSMSPRIEEGDYVVISTDSCCDNQDIVAVRFDLSGHVTLKRYVVTGDVILLKPENPKYDPIVVTDEIKILGKVIYLIRKKF